MLRYSVSPSVTLHVAVLHIKIQYSYLGNLVMLKNAPSLGDTRDVLSVIPVEVPPGFFQRQSHLRTRSSSFRLLKFSLFSVYWSAVFLASLQLVENGT